MIYDCVAIKQFIDDGHDIPKHIISLVCLFQELEDILLGELFLLDLVINMQQSRIARIIAKKYRFLICHLRQGIDDGRFLVLGNGGAAAFDFIEKIIYATHNLTPNGGLAVAWPGRHGSIYGKAIRQGKKEPMKIIRRERNKMAATSAHDPTAIAYLIFPRHGLHPILLKERGSDYQRVSSVIEPCVKNAITRMDEVGQDPIQCLLAVGLIIQPSGLDDPGFLHETWHVIVLFWTRPCQAG
jgi:hypothetical protein